VGVGPIEYVFCVAGLGVGRKDLWAQGRAYEHLGTMTSLTPTELDVVRHIAAGRTNRQIGEHMVISPGTVKVHLSHIFAKLGISSRSHLAAEATRRGLAPPAATAR
jgi:DNA-binding CsgD family transcriptional regulator